MSRLKVLGFFIWVLLWGPATAFSSEFRHYDVQPTGDEREFVFYIVNTLGNKSLDKIWRAESSLKRAGDKIDHLHPLRFLEIVFTDEELKAAIRNLKNKRLVWSQFKGGLYGSLTEEAGRGNLTEDQVLDFTNNIGIDIAIIYPSILKADWDEMLTLLIKNVPREGDPGRYDM